MVFCYKNNSTRVSRTSLSEMREQRRIIIVNIYDDDAQIKVGGFLFIDVHILVHHLTVI